MTSPLAGWKTGDSGYRPLHHAVQGFCRNEISETANLWTDFDQRYFSYNPVGSVSGRSFNAGFKK
jgi:hypothetical protein